MVSGLEFLGLRGLQSEPQQLVVRLLADCMVIVGVGFATQEVRVEGW